VQNNARKIVLRQRHLGIGVFRHQDRGPELAVVENGRRRNIAAGGRNQQQNRDCGTVAAIRQRGQEIIRERLVAMAASAGNIAELGEELPIPRWAWM
jgi:hypothetical protein